MKPQNIQTNIQGGIVGARLAAEVIGVHMATAFRYLAKEVYEPAEDGPIAIKHRSKNGWAWRWRDADHVRAWWKRVRGVTVLPVPSTPVIPKASMPKPKRSVTETAEDEQLAQLFGTSVVANAEALRARLDTPAVRAIRKARNQPVEMPLTEVLSMVIALGFTHWPEE